MNDKQRIAISFSGGRSSAVMTRLLLLKYSETHDIKVIFCNTGCEHEATLEFVRDCDKNWTFGTVWIEAIIGPPGVGSRAKVVTFETASRNGEPFEAAVAKFGVFSKSHPQCTSRLKTEVKDAYLAYDCGWKKGTYKTAIGIRADEVDRCNFNDESLWYPLVDEGITKNDVGLLMQRAGFDLHLPSDAYGNCVWCWKKSLRKLMTVAKANPEAFDFPARMEKQYSEVKALPGERRVFFRGHRSTKDILEMASGHFQPYSDKVPQVGLFDFELDIGGSCGESCEIGAE